VKFRLLKRVLQTLVTTFSRCFFTDKPVSIKLCLFLYWLVHRFDAGVVFLKIYTLCLCCHRVPRILHRLSLQMSGQNHTQGSLQPSQHLGFVHQNSAYQEIFVQSPISKLIISDMADATERTFIMIKPDGVQRGLVGDIINRFEKRGYKLVALKLLQAPRVLLENHYEEHKGKKFYEPLLAYIGSGPVVAMVWEGLNVISVGRKMLGATDPAKSEPGTIRGDYAIVTGRNIVHGSDSEKAAKREIDLWFKPDEVANWTSTAERWIYE
jgi:nucleoside-diphosphate kinase